MTKRSRPLWFRLIRGLAIVYAGLCVFSCTMADRLIFMPQRPAYTTKAPALVRLPTSKGESIVAFYYPAKPGKPTVLYSHGNAEDIGNSIELYQQWRNDGWGILPYDYPGYGHSSGSPSESSSERAIDAAWSFLTGDHSVTPSKIIVVGRSVGSGPSVYLASKHPCAGLVLISPFTSTFAIHSPLQHILPGDRFPNLKRIRKIDTPLLVIHGERDSIIPTDHGRTLHQASPAKIKHFVGVPNAGHNDIDWMDVVSPTRAFATTLPDAEN